MAAIVRVAPVRVKVTDGPARAIAYACSMPDAHGLAVTLTNVYPPLGINRPPIDMPGRLTGRRQVGALDQVEIEIRGASDPVWVPWRQVPELDEARMASLTFELLD